MIVRLGALSGGRRQTALTALEKIFFASSLRQTFPDAAARAAFFATWTGWYLTNAPDDVWLWREDETDGDGWLGYLTGCRDSAAAAGLFATIPGYARFADMFEMFPAHLHINVAENARGRGVGATLINAFVADCGAGAHVVTAPQARNRGFYHRNGFTATQERGGLLFMGRRAG